jgi:cytochrome b subunit of formate dehydrogenase
MIKKDEKVKWYLNPIVVILLLFFVLGPLGLPLLYKSPKFNRASKIILTVLVAVYTIYLIYATIKIGIELSERMQGIQEMFNQ